MRPYPMWMIKAVQARPCPSCRRPMRPEDIVGLVVRMVHARPDSPTASVGPIGELEAWLRRRLAETRSRQRSINLPAGRVGLRAAPMKLIVEDEDAAVAWAREHCPAAVTTVTTTKISKTVLHEHLQKTGELPDCGVRLEPPTGRLIIR